MLKGLKYARFVADTAIGIRGGDLPPHERFQVSLPRLVLQRSRRHRFLHPAAGGAAGGGAPPGGEVPVQGGGDGIGVCPRGGHLAVCAHHVHGGGTDRQTTGTCTPEIIQMK